MSKLAEAIPFFMMLISAGLAFDHYFLLPERMTERFKKKCDETGVCPLCERPMIIVEDEK